MSRCPTPLEIRAAREAAGLTQTKAAALLYKTCRVWQMYEAGDRGMDPAFWGLFKIKVARAPTTTCEDAMKLEDYPSLACPSCSRATPPKRLNADQSVTYHCAAKNHEATHGRAETWRITKHGNFQAKTAAGHYVNS